MNKKLTIMLCSVLICLNVNTNIIAAPLENNNLLQDIITNLDTEYATYINNTYAWFAPELQEQIDPSLEKCTEILSIIRKIQNNQIQQNDLTILQNNFNYLKLLNHDTQLLGADLLSTVLYWENDINNIIKNYTP